MKKENVKAENLGRLIKPIFEIHSDGIQYFNKHIWLPLFGGLRDLIMHESRNPNISIQIGFDQNVSILEETLVVAEYEWLKFQLISASLDLCQSEGRTPESHPVYFNKLEILLSGKWEKINRDFITWTPENIKQIDHCLGSTSGIRACALRNFDLRRNSLDRTLYSKNEMELRNYSKFFSIPTAKLPMLKQGEYEMWKLIIEQYFQVEDYALWDVRENGNSFKPTAQTTTNADGSSTTLIPGSKTLFAAIQTRFGGNDATKKTQKTLLKQMYENFSAPSTESLNSIFNRLQKIRNKPDLDTMSIDDLYNNFKIVEQKVKRTANLSSSSSSQNMAFVSTPSSTNEVNTAYEVITCKLTQLVLSVEVYDHVQGLTTIYRWKGKGGIWNNYTRVNYNYSTKKAYPSAHRKIAPRAVLMKTSLRPLNTARPVNTAHHKTTVHSARPMSRFSKSAQSTVKKPYQIKTTLTNNNFSQKVNTTKGSFYTTRPKAVNTARIKEVNTARQNLAVVNDVMANQGHPQKISMNSMDDMLPLEEEQMEANLLMCDIKNNVLFTDTEYLVLSPNFKLPDESQILLRVPRKNNMYSVDMKNIVPKESLTCLVAKATLDESMLWHRRLGIRREFSMSRTPQQNGVAERRNRTLIEAARTMVLVVKPHIKTPYELFRGRTPALSFMRPFGCHVTILNTLDYLGKFNGKSDEGFFIGYSLNSKAFRVYNTRTRKVEENLHVRFLEDKPIIADNRPEWLFDIDMLTKLMNYVPVVAGTNSNDFAGTKDSIGAGHSSKEMGSSQDCILMLLDAERKEHGVIKESGIDNQERPENSSQDINTAGPSINTASTNITTDHSLDHVIGDVLSGVQTRRMTTTSNEQGFISVVYEGKTHEDLNTCLFACFLSQIEPTRVAKALSDPTWGKKTIGTKWVFRNKKDKRGIVIKNKVRLVAHGYTQEEGIDYDEVFAPVARIEAIRLFLAYASFMGFMVYQMDIKSAFLYERIEEEVKSEQALYMVCFQVSQEPDESIYGELTFFLGLQVKQKQDGIFISHDKYVVEVLRKFNFSDVKSASTPLDTKKTLVKDADGDTLFELVAYTDSNYARASLDRKSTTRGCQFLGSRLISWQCKKQTVVATSTTKAKYVAAASCCGQTSEPIPNVADKAVYEEWGDRVERASTTAASLDAEQASATVRLQEELDEEERQKMARVHEAAQSFTEEEWENIKARVKANEELAQSNKQGKGTKAELDHEGSKRQKTNEASRSVQEQFDEEEKELSKGIMLLMLVKKLLVDQHSEMAN
ncbi:putative ribonuclease H-like domain-containing protein [Tanacetum coccineum]